MQTKRLSKIQHVAVKHMSELEIFSLTQMTQKLMSKAIKEHYNHMFLKSILKQTRVHNHDIII